MNYYPFHLGDYAAHTAHLTPIEDIAYRRLLDLYYLREAPLPTSDDLPRLIRMREHADVVAAVLGEFFEDGAECWRHPRCDEEIVRYRAMVDGGRNGAAKRWAKGGDAPPIARPEGGDTGGHPPPNANQNQNQNHNQKEREESPRKRATLPKPADVGDQTWDDWSSLRKQKRAPVTATVIDGARREAGKAGMTLDDFLAVWCTRGSQGLQADWLKPQERQFTRQTAESFKERDDRAARERWEEMTGRKWPTTGQVIDGETVDADATIRTNVRRITA